MPTFGVQLWPDGNWDQKDYQKVDAATAKEVAEKLYGKPPSEIASNFQMGARIHSLIPRDNATAFYDRSS